MLNKWRENTREILKLQTIMIQIINVKLQMIDAIIQNRKSLSNCFLYEYFRFQYHRKTFISYSITYICENCLISFIIHST